MMRGRCIAAMLALMLAGCASGEGRVIPKADRQSGPVPVAAIEGAAVSAAPAAAEASPAPTAEPAQGQEQETTVAVTADASASGTTEPEGVAGPSERRTGEPEATAAPAAVESSAAAKETPPVDEPRAEPGADQAAAVPCIEPCPQPVTGGVEGIEGLEPVLAAVSDEPSAGEAVAATRFVSIPSGFPNLAIAPYRNSEAAARGTLTMGVEGPRVWSVLPEEAIGVRSGNPDFDLPFDLDLSLLADADLRSDPEPEARPQPGKLSAATELDLPPDLMPNLALEAETKLLSAPTVELTAAEADAALRRLIGISPEETVALLGEPKSRESRPPALVWTYEKAPCTLALFYYLDVETQALRALAFELSVGEREPETQQRCVQRLMTPQAS